MRRKSSLLVGLALLSTFVPSSVGAEQQPPSSGQAPADEAPFVNRAGRPAFTEFEYAYIDKTGKVVITGPFAAARSFSNGVASVEEKQYQWRDGHWAPPVHTGFNQCNTIIDAQNHVINKVGLTGIESFKDGYAVARLRRGTEITNNYVLVDTKGGTTPIKKCRRATNYAEDLFAFESAPEEGATTETPDGYGYMDKSGQLLIPCSFSMPGPFSEGLAAVAVTPPDSSDAKSKPGVKAVHWEFHYIDKSGKSVIAGPFDQARAFSGGLAGVCVGGKWGFVDRDGKMAIPLQYEWVGRFSGRLAPVEQHGMVGFIDKTGKTVIPFKFKKAESFSDGLAPATADGAKWGYIDENGDFKIEPAYLDAHPFSSSSGLAMVHIKPRTDIGTHPEEAQYFYDTANALREDGLLNDAVRYCDTVVKIAPGTEWAKRAANLKAVALPDHSIKQSLLDLLQKGTICADHREFAEASKYFQQCLDQDPGFIQASGSLGYCLVSLKKFDEAQKVLSATVAKYPNYARGYFRLAQAYEGLGKLSDAQTTLDKAKNLAPDDLLFQVYELTQTPN